MALRLAPLARRADVDATTIRLAFLARAADELLGGVLLVLVPTFRRTFRLDLVQVALLEQVLFWVALAVEPPASLLIDTRSRRALMAFGAGALGASLVVAGLAPSYAVLVAAFALYGLGSGPLAHPADVVIVEAHPGDEERAFARGTLYDTVGTIAAPLAAAALASTGAWRLGLVVGGVASFAYAVALARSRVPRANRDNSDGSWRDNVRSVVSTPEARAWLVFLFVFEAVEAPQALRLVWLSEEVGLGQAGTALFVTAEQVTALAAVAALDRWLAPRRSLLPVAAAAIVVLYPTWILVPGVAARVLIGLPLAFAFALLWPLARGRSLAAVPGREGALTALTTLFPLVPFPLLLGALAGSIGLTAALLVVAVVGPSLLFLTALRLTRFEAHAR